MPPEIMETPPFPRIPSFPGDRASRPREGTFPRPPLAVFNGGARSFAGAPRAAVGAAAGGLVALERAGASWSILKPRQF